MLYTAKHDAMNLARASTKMLYRFNLDRKEHIVSSVCQYFPINPVISEGDAEAFGDRMHGLRFLNVASKLAYLVSLQKSDE